MPGTFQWGDCQHNQAALSCEPKDGLTYTVADVSTDRCIIDVKLRLNQLHGSVGIAIRTQHDFRPGYIFWLDVDCNQVRYCKLPAPYWDLSFSRTQYKFK